tara:strand:- start:2634 stop:3509 length:876 start_codon:yes stop_codon:yes gene_type:complete
MDDLTMHLMHLCRRNRDGSYGTKTNRQRGLTAIARELRELGYKLPTAASIKPKHVTALVEKWSGEDKTDASIRNRLTWLRWWAEKINKPNVVHPDNAYYGVADRGGEIRNRARTLQPDDLTAIACPFVQASVLLQVSFGLRREEALKFRPKDAIKFDRIVLQGSWTKGGRAREIPLTTLEQRQTLQQVSTLIKGAESLIPPELSYIEQLKRYEYQTLKAGLRNTHGFRHAYAQQRYQVLTGQPCPLANGKHWQEMTATERETDRIARRQIATELGHGRLEITDTYLGRAFQ